MAIYIKGMKMPKGCYECPLMDGEYGDCKVGATGLYDPYMEDCPLIEVPEPYGKLTDADALYASIAKDTYLLTDESNNRDYGMFLIDIRKKTDEAQTVIERIE